MNRTWGIAPLLLPSLMALMALALLPAGAFAVTLPVPLDVNTLAAQGHAKITATTFDIKDASAVFDADRSTLARTPSINPAFVQVVFDAPQTISGVRVQFTSERHDWTMKTGAGETPETLTTSQTFRGDDPQIILFPQPVTARSFRLDVKRLEGDDYVHIVDWELLQPGEVSGLTVQRPKDDRIADADITQNTVLTFTATAKAADGRALDVTRDVQWSSTSEGVTPWTTGGAKNRFIVSHPGEAAVTATLGELSGTAKVQVKPVETRNNDFDLDAMYIERTPRLNYDGPNGGWPKRGAKVQWVAHLHNWGERDIASVGYAWVLDGRIVDRGTVRDWMAGTDASVALPWKWQQKRHDLTFILDSEADYPDEASKGNNQVTISTDALAVGYWVEDGLWRYMHEHQRELGDGANSFEDWGQRQMRLWNTMFENAKYGSAPGGILDRVRLDYIVRVPNGALPLNGGLPTNNPDGTDKTVDLMWGMTAADMGPGKFWDVKHSGPFYYEYGLIHELDHARYLIDSYGFDVHKPAVADLMLPDGTPMAGTPAMPMKGDVLRYDKYRGMMDSTHYFSEFEAYAWNRIAGQRARKGNQNGPDDIGAYLNEDLPERNHVRFVDMAGHPLSGVTVEVHQARPMKDTWYGKTYVQTPDLTFTADADGWVNLPRNPFGEKIDHTYGHANSVLLFVVRKGDVVRTAFQEVSDFNLQYWKGQKQDAYYQVTLNFAPGNATLGQTIGLTGRS